MWIRDMPCAPVSITGTHPKDMITETRGCWAVGHLLNIAMCNAHTECLSFSSVSGCMHRSFLASGASSATGAFRQGLTNTVFYTNYDLKPSEAPSFGQIACVGAGLSAVGRRSTAEIVRPARHSVIQKIAWELVGGCGCDVPSAFYIFSFALNPNWTKLMPSNKGIKKYVDSEVDTCKPRGKIAFGTEVVRSVWREDANRWHLNLRDLNSGRQYAHESQSLFAATGQLIEPRQCEIPSTWNPQCVGFPGSIFLLARWDHSVDLEERNVIVIGNGCLSPLAQFREEI